MNNFTNSDGLPPSYDVGGFPYILAISVGIIFLLTTVTLASFFCCRINHGQPRPPATIQWSADHQPNETRNFAVDLELGLDERTIESYPKLLHSEAQRRSDGSGGGCCSICLADYRSSDMLRLLPDCGHLFHRRCVDPWLRLNPSCPVCRTSPVPTPVSTPLAEVVPLAIGRS